MGSNGADAEAADVRKTTAEKENNDGDGHGNRGFLPSQGIPSGLLGVHYGAPLNVLDIERCFGSEA